MSTVLSSPRIRRAVVVAPTKPVLLVGNVPTLMLDLQKWLTVRLDRLPVLR